MSDSGQYLGTSPELDAGYRMYRTQGADWPTDLGSEWAALAGGGFNAGDVSDTAGSAGAVRQQDLSTREGMDDFLLEVRAKNVIGDEISPQDISTAKALLYFYHGYAMGEQRGSQADLEGSLDGTRTAAFTRALEDYAGNSATLNQERFDFYSNIKVAYDANGNATNGRYIDIERDGDRRRITWTGNFASTATQVGVSADETLRKTAFDVYQKAVNAAFATPGMTGFDISGGWRPHPADYLAIKGAPSPLPNESSPHILGRALDITMVRYSEDWQSGYTIDNRTNNQPVQPEMVREFSYNLQVGASKIAQPWMTYGTYLAIPPRADMGNGYVENAGRTRYERLHLNHMDVAF